jgi:hypothetical protein
VVAGLFISFLISSFVQVLDAGNTRHSARSAGRRPKSEGTKSREVGQRLGGECYGDLMLGRVRWRVPPRLAAACECLDHDHGGAATRAWAGQHAWRLWRDIRLLLWIGGRRGDIEECAGRRDVLGAVGVGKEPAMADAVSPRKPWFCWADLTTAREMAALPRIERRCGKSRGSLLGRSFSVPCNAG